MTSSYTKGQKVWMLSSNFRSVGEAEVRGVRPSEDGKNQVLIRSTVTRGKTLTYIESDEWPRKTVCGTAYIYLDNKPERCAAIDVHLKAMEENEKALDKPNELLAQKPTAE